MVLAVQDEVTTIISNLNNALDLRDLVEVRRNVELLGDIYKSTDLRAGQMVRYSSFFTLLAVREHEAKKSASVDALNVTAP